MESRREKKREGERWKEMERKIERERPLYEKVRGREGEMRR